MINYKSVLSLFCCFIIYCTGSCVKEKNCPNNEVLPVRDLLVKINRSLLNNDRSAFKDSFFGSKEGLEIIDLTFSLHQRLYLFIDLLKEKYGEDAFERFVKSKVSPSFSISHFFRRDNNWYLSDQIVKVDRCSYRWLSPNTNQEFIVLFKDGVWKIDADLSFKTSEYNFNVIKFYDKAISTLSYGIRLLKKDKETSIDEIKLQLGKKMWGDVGYPNKGRT